MKLKAVSMFVMGIMFFTMVISACMPPEATAEELAAMEKARKDSVRKANSRYCMKHLSFATEYYKNKAYPDALYNYHKLFDYECVDEQMAPNVYVYMGNSYREMDNLDSAIILYDEGLGLIPDNKYLWENKIFTMKMAGDEEALLKVKVEMYAQFPEDSLLAEEIADTYIEWGMYDEALALVKQLLITNPGDINLMGMQREIMEATGVDTRPVVEKEYEDNPSNVANAQDFVRILRDAGENERAITVLEGMLENSPGMTSYMKDLIEIYRELGKTKSVITLLKKLNTANPEDVRIYFDMTQAYIEDGQLKSAMTWAGKAIKADPSNGQTYANRASVLEAVGLQCTGSTPDFDDKLVFMMAYEDYKTAKSKGYGKAANKIDFLKEARIPQSGDWFFNRDDYVRGGKAKPKKECYTWLKRSVTAPKK